MRKGWSGRHYRYLERPSSTAITVEYAVVGGTSTPGSDYDPVSGLLTFAPSVTAQSFTLQVFLDGVVDDGETVFLALNSPDVASLGEPSDATLTIYNTIALFLPAVSR